MGKLTDKDHIYNIALYSARIKYYISGMTRDQFYDDIKTRDAVNHCLYNIGKSIKGISEETRILYEGFPSEFTLLCMDGGYYEEDLWDVLKDKNMGVLKYFNKFQKMHDLESQTDSTTIINQKKNLFIIKGESVKGSKDLPLDTNYKYPIKSKHSIRTVRKK